MTRPSLPDSLWAATARPAPDTPPLADETTADVVIVGGGFTGLSAALHAAEGGADVVLIETAEPGFGASGRNGGQVIPGLKLDPDEVVSHFGPEKGERFVDLAGRGPDIVFGLIEKHAIACDAARKGWIQGIHASKAMPAAEHRAGQWQKRGVAVEVVDRQGMAALSGAQGYVGGVVDPRGGTLNPLGFARGLAGAAIAAGARMHGASPATAMRREGKAWRVETPAGAVTAQQVILCTNGYTDGLWPGLKKRIIPIFGYQIATRPLSDNVRRTILPQGHAVSDTRRLLNYFRLDPEGRLAVGGRGAFRDTSDPRFYKPVIAALRRLFPQVEDETFEFHWGGELALTLDHLPQLSDLAPGVTAALAYNGRGVAMSTAMGTVLAERVSGTPLEDLAVPARPIRRIPFHSLRGPVISALIGWKRLLDLKETGT